MLVKAAIQPIDPNSNCANGTTANCPKEAPALIMPLAMPRFSGGSTRPIADITTPRPVMPAPPAATTPTNTISIQVLVA